MQIVFDFIQAGTDKMVNLLWDDFLVQTSSNHEKNCMGGGFHLKHPLQLRGV